MTRIKICGITNGKDARAAVEVGADALGFVFYPKSPRFISPDRAQQIRRDIPPFTVCIGVFVEEEKEKVFQIAEQCQLNGLQLHGNESPDYCSCFSQYSVIKAFSLRSGKDLPRITHYSVQAILIDAFDPVLLGGTGKKADWELAKEVKKFGPLILAGGLDEVNIQEAIRAVNPYAVDVSSSLEVRPGIKDHAKMKRFVSKVREIDRLFLDC